MYISIVNDSNKEVKLGREKKGSSCCCLRSLLKVCSARQKPHGSNQKQKLCEKGSRGARGKVEEEEKLQLKEVQEKKRTREHHTGQARGHDFPVIVCAH